MVGTRFLFPAARCAALALAFALFPAGALASTPCEQGGDCGPTVLTSQLYGFIASNTTLTFAAPGPIYDVLGDVIVNPGVTLTVQPGVTLRFAAFHDTLQGGVYPGLAELTIRGTLAADASSGDSIRFVGTNGGPYEWGHIRTEAAGSLTIRRVHIHGAYTGAVLLGTGSHVIENSLVTGCLDGIQAGSSSAIVREMQIIGLGTGSGTGLTGGAGLQTTPADSLNPTPSVVAGFQSGIVLNGALTVGNIVARDNGTGFTTSNDGQLRTINYCTAVRNTYGFSPSGNTLVLNCIAALNASVGFYLYATYTDYIDSWSNGNNYIFGGNLGPHNASFSPFFLNPSADDFRLADNSIFKNYSNSGGEIGAYGPGTCIAVVVDPSEARSVASLRASPNPTRGTAVLEFEQTTPGRVTVDILDVLGRRMRRVADDFRTAGTQRVAWEGRDEQGASVPAGLYFWRVASGSGIRTGRLVVSR